MKLLKFLFLLLLASHATAEIPVFAVKGVAIGGVDVVAYFTDNTPTMGKLEYSIKWRGQRWQFDSQKHLELFSKNPSQYAPQFGGFCSLTTAHGASIPINPMAWSIHKERLYLFVFESARDTWLMNPAQLIQRAEKNWLAANKQTKYQTQRKGN